MYHVRRGDKEIADREVLERILESTSYVTLAMSLGDQPYLVSVSHGYDSERGCLYFHCAREGKKMDYLRLNNRVWGQALLDYGHSGAEGECTHLYASVHFSGRVTFLENLSDKSRAIECLARQVGWDPEILSSRVRPERLDQTTIGRIDIEYISGKKSREVSLQLAAGSGGPDR